MGRSKLSIFKRKNQCRLVRHVGMYQKMQQEKLRKLNHERQNSDFKEQLWFCQMSVNSILCHIHITEGLIFKIALQYLLVKQFTSGDNLPSKVI